jgi:hypothetical protein
MTRKLGSSLVVKQRIEKGVGLFADAKSQTVILPWTFLERATLKLGAWRVSEV